MSHKIKILDQEQYAALLASRGKKPERPVRLYVAAILPGLFYCADDYINGHDGTSFVFLPPSTLESPYSLNAFDRIVYKNISVSPARIEFDDHLFVPLTVENMVVGGLYGHRARFKPEQAADLLQELGVDDQFGQIFNINDTMVRVSRVAVELLNTIAATRTPDSFFKALPEIIRETIGGGQISFYYHNQESFILRKMIGQLGDYEEMPAVLEGEAGDEYVAAIREGKSFLSYDSLPDYPTELRYAPKVKFVLGGNIDDDLGYLLTGLMPSITAYSPALFIEKLGELLGGVSQRHFTRNPDWHRLFAALDELIAAGNPEGSLAEFLMRELNERINVNRVSVEKFFPLENRVQISGAATPHRKSSLAEKKSIAISGTDFEQVLSSGRSCFTDLTASASLNSVHRQLYREGVRSVVLLPILSEGTMFGFLGIGSPMAGSYLKQYVPIFDIIAGYIAKLQNIKNNRHTIEILSDQLDHLEGKLSAMENIRTLGELAGGVFHDLNNVIGAILGRCQLILSRANAAAGEPIPEKIIRDVRLIEKSALDSGEILKRLRKLAQTGQKSERRQVDLIPLINDVVELIGPRWARLTQQKGLSITMQKNLPETAMILADASEIREVFTNLLLNGLDALPDGGEITVTGRLIENRVVIDVIDNGIGIPAEIADDIFEPFFTTKGEKGTGLGLSLSRKIIERHGGRLEMRPAPDRGTVFTVALPLAISNQITAEVDRPRPVRKAGLNILIVEDREELQATLSELLESKGLKVARASSGEEAIKMCGQCRFDLLLTDLGLPGISGLELAAQVKTIDKKVRVILISGWEIDQSVSDLMAQGVDSLLTKPFSAESIMETIENLFGSSATSAS